jgi:F0F1-type ATP synthase assembly protein I
MVVMAGSILGAALGSAIGVHVHSDNLPFFIMLGTVIGLCLSGVMSLVIVR